MRYSILFALNIATLIKSDNHRSSTILQPEVNPIPRPLVSSSNRSQHELGSAALAAETLQPGMNALPMFIGNFSKNPEDWPHSTPLLQQPFGNHTTGLIKPRATKFWSGWQSVSYIFAFGDSYTSTNFTVNGEQPSGSNPLGNPAYPGATSTDGPNFIDFLTTTYNQSFVQTYNFAYGGAVVNDSVVQNGFGINVQSFVNQVEKEFLPKYVNDADVPWNAQNSLFSIFFGINDVTNSYLFGNDFLNCEVIESYQNVVNQLYAAGARNFLFLNVPPVDRSPGTLTVNKTHQSSEAAYIGAFNFRLDALVYNLGLRHPDTTSFIFDTNFLFTRVIDDPGQFEETSKYKNVTGYCDSYAQWTQSGYTNGYYLEPETLSLGGTPMLTYFNPACGIPINQYLWLNTLHPTYPMHNFMGSQIAKLLEIVS